MSRCVALGIAESSGQFYLSRCLNIRHRDRETVERDSGYSHRDRLSPRNETNRNVSLAVLYKFLLVRRSERIVLNLARIVEYLKTVKESGEGLPFPIWEIKSPQDSMNMSFKFVCPGGKKVRVNVFYPGKVNILGAHDVETPPPPLTICDYLSTLFHAHWSEFIVLQPLPAKAKWSTVLVFYV